MVYRCKTIQLGVILKYLEFLSSAKRHDYACRVLQEKIESYEENTYDEKFKFLVISLYYLSGYIIECSLKFKILEVSGFNSNVEVNKNECKKIGIIYHEQIKTHDFTRLQDFLDSKIPDLSHESDNDEIECLLTSWDPTIRYEDISIEYRKVKSFYNHANDFLKKM